MPHFAIATLPPNKKAHPVEVSLLSAEAIVKVSDPLPHLVKKPCGAQNWRAGFHLSETQAASHIQEESMTRISRTVRFIPQVLRDTLGYALGMR